MSWPQNSLKLLNTVDVSQKVVEHVCRYGGPFGGMDGILVKGHAEVLSQLAEIDTGAVAGLLERLLANVNDLAGIIGDTRKHLVWAVAKIAFEANTFEAGAYLLLQLAIAESKNEADHATRWFEGLFPLILGRTEADGARRLELLDALFKTDDPTELQLVIKALTQGLKLDYFTRDVGPEVHGTRPELNSWEPKTEEEARSYIRGVPRGSSTSRLGAMPSVLWHAMPWVQSWFRSPTTTSSISLNVQSRRRELPLSIGRMHGTGLVFTCHDTAPMHRRKWWLGSRH